ncbi:Glycosyl transferase [Macleaya cordata]|uniref:Glycosyltransferases n=1 Tax=Macleaya cordata TaxID=56857 RepID=A0A200R621_MACCD|nr:Glycosyl transferase [Macleaya cordata]
MGSLDRSKKRAQLWKKAMFHFSLCFVMGFFTGFAPSGTSSILNIRIKSIESTEDREFSPEPIESLHQVENLNRSLIAEIPVAVPTSTGNYSAEKSQIDEFEEELVPLKQLIVITPTTSNDRLQGAFLRRLGYTLKLVPQPLLWIVVESGSDSSELSEILRKTGIMYRHLVYKENFTDSEAEMDHQRNLALNHIEHHRLNGIVHFAGVYDVYDLEFFERIREIEDFGTWPTATVSANRKRVVMEGPVCDSEADQVVGWHLKNTSSNETTNNNNNMGESWISISNFGFNSSILWDPERWGRPSSTQDASSQNSIKFVQEMVVEDETKLKGLPVEDCSKILLWHLHLPSTLRIHDQSSSSSITTSTPYSDTSNRR